MYEEIDAMNRNITPPLLVQTCQPSSQCSYINNVGGSFGFRLLPGDVSYGTGLFKGYKITNIEETTTILIEQTTTTSIPEVDCSKFNFWSCINKLTCQWIGSSINGYCYEKTSKISTISTTTTTSAVFTTSKTSVTTTITCLQSNNYCTSSFDCCSGECKQICIQPSILGFCIFNLYVWRCS